MQHFIAAIAIILTSTACAPERQLPEAGSSLSSDGTGTTTSTSTGTQTGTGTGTGTGTSNNNEYYGIGANVGSAANKRDVAACNNDHHFFNRAGNGGRGLCDTTRKVPAKCTTAQEVKLALQLDADQSAALDAVIAGPLNTYLFDQCVDDANAYNVYMVKVNPNNSLIFTPIPIDK